MSLLLLESAAAALPQVCISEAWKECQSMQVLVGGAWKSVEAVKVLVGGVWEDAT